MEEEERQILVLAIEALSKKLNDLVADCLDGNGKPKAPSMKTISVSRASLPAKYSMSFNSENKK